MFEAIVKVAEEVSDLMDDITNDFRPYNKEKRHLQSCINFGVMSRYLADRVLEEFKDVEHKEALKINKGMN